MSCFLENTKVIQFVLREEVYNSANSNDILLTAIFVLKGSHVMVSIGLFDRSFMRANYQSKNHRLRFCNVAHKNYVT